MLVSSFCASRPRDATRRMRATELVLRSSVVAATPSQQQLRRSSTSHYNLARNWSSHRRVHRRCAAGCTSRRDAARPRGGTRAARSISSVAAASAPSQQQQLATAVSRDDERSTWAPREYSSFSSKYKLAAPRISFYLATFFSI